MLRIVVILLISLIMLIGVEVLISYQCLTITNYKIKSDKIGKNVRIMLLSDLHDNELGKDNKRLIDKITEQKPDLILMDGDMLNEEGKNADSVLHLVKRVRKIAPVYYALGNHERGYLKRKTSNLYSELTRAGACILEEKYQDIRINGNNLRIGGMYGYAFAVDGEGKMAKDNMKPLVRDFLTDFENTDAFKIMMSHRPDSFIFGQAADTWNIDLVASGHAHGGQVILPLIGGLYGADQGWFPKYVSGMHHFKEVKNMVITRGLGSDKEKLPRINNIPEIVMIDLCRK